MSWNLVQQPILPHVERQRLVSHLILTALTIALFANV